VAGGPARPAGRSRLSRDRPLPGTVLRQLPAHALALRATPRAALRAPDAEQPRHLCVLAGGARRRLRRAAPTWLRGEGRDPRQPRVRLRHQPLRLVLAGQRVGPGAEPRFQPGRDRPRLRRGEPPAWVARAGPGLPDALARGGVPAAAVADGSALRGARPPHGRPAPAAGGGLRGLVDGALRRLPGLAQLGALRRPVGVRPPTPRLRPEPAPRPHEPALPSLARLPRRLEAAAAPGPMAAARVRHERHRVLAPQPGARGRAVGAAGATLRPVDPRCGRLRLRHDRDRDPDVRVGGLGAVRLPLHHRSASRRLRRLRVRLRSLPAPAAGGLARHLRPQPVRPGRLEALPPPAARRALAAGCTGGVVAVGAERARPRSHPVVRGRARGRRGPSRGR
jgi:hypothetical protein